VEKLQRNACVLREALGESGLPVAPGETPIVPLIVGDANAAVAASDRALENGIFAQAIRPPTVPAGTCRLRLTAMATHRVGDLRKAARLIGRTARELGLSDGVAARGGPPSPAAAPPVTDLPQAA
jgi:8-amino-7-oxononanoate synthase